VLIGANFTKRTRRLDSFKYEISNSNESEIIN
jgi:hypothetical protein